MSTGEIRFANLSGEAFTNDSGSVQTKNMEETTTTRINSSYVYAPSVVADFVYAPLVRADSLVSADSIEAVSLNVSGASTTNGIKNTGSVETDDLKTGTLNVSGASTTNGIKNTGSVETDSMRVNSNAQIGGNLAVGGSIIGASVRTRDLNVEGDAVVHGGLTVGGTLKTNAAATPNVQLGTSSGAMLDIDNSNVRLMNNTGHGVSVSGTSTTLSGGTSSTTLTLDDSGATFRNTTGGGTGPARVTGVANGRDQYDAVNYGQLKTAYRGAASAAALAGVPSPLEGKNYSIGIGYGNFSDENAVAIGAKAHYSNISAAVGGAFSGPERMVNVGVGYSW